MFFQSDIVIKGDKARKMQELRTLYGFELYDIYLISAVIGFRNHKTDSQSKDPDNKYTANIPRTVLIKRAEKMDFVSKVMVLTEQINTDSKKAMDLAFEESTANEPKKLYRMDLFNEYALGGIDIFYDMISKVSYENQVDNLKNILDTYNSEDDSNKKIEDVLEKEGF